MPDREILIEVAVPRPYRAVFSTRAGGVSRGPYSSLNLGFHVKDDPTSVLENRRRFYRAAGMEPEYVVAMQQVHGKNVRVVAPCLAGSGSLSDEGALLCTDGLITCEPGIGLIAFYADCVPVMIYDTSRHVLGLCHAGWKGTVLRIALETVREMVHLGGASRTMGAVIGPCICQKCYEVGEEVASGALELPGSPVKKSPRVPGKWHFDLQEANRQVLMEAGLSPASISVLPYCTSCNRDLFFSHRRDSHPTGRMAMLCWIERTKEC